MMTALLVGVFGVAGALLRFAVDSWFAHHPGRRRTGRGRRSRSTSPDPSSSAVSLGLTGQLELGRRLARRVATGWPAGLTTFSSWTTATVRLVSETRYRAAALNIGANLLAGLAAAALGVALAG